MITTVAVVVQLLLSLTDTVYVPAQSPDTVLGVVMLFCVRITPLGPVQVKSHGETVPVAVAVAEPVQAPKQVMFVCVSVGALQHDNTALN